MKLTHSDTLIYVSSNQIYGTVQQVTPEGRARVTEGFCAGMIRYPLRRRARSAEVRRMTRRRLVVAITLVFWVLLGPVGMAFSGCAMMATCGAPCALTSCVMPSISIQAVPLSVTFVQAALFSSPSSTFMKVPPPPPRAQTQTT
jgi:hypothetical protein